MKKVLIFWILQLYISSIYAQDIHSNSALILPQGGDYTIGAGQTVKISSGVSVTLLPGIHLQQNSSVSIQIVTNPIIPPPPANPSDDSDKNWVLNRIYDEDGNLVSTSKGFFDNTGKLLQTQVKSVSTGHVLASQPIYDAQGRAALATLPAPINNSEFKYEVNFASNSSGTPYNFRNFEDPGNTTNPNLKRNNADPVGNASIGTLGWYYSNNNSFESHIPISNYPYSRTEFYDDGTGAAKRFAATGDELRMGKGHEMSSNSFPVLSELDFYKAIKNKFFAAITGESNALSGKGVQTYSEDENGVQEVSVTDLSGKPLMFARAAENDEVLSITNSANLINKTGYIYNFAGNEMGASAKELVITGKGAIKVYESIDGGTTYTITYNGAASSYVSPATLTGMYKVESDQVFYLSYKDNTSSLVCDDCEARIASFGNQQLHYFKLFKPTAVMVTGSNFKLYNMSGDEKEMSSFNSGDVLPSGYYKAAVVEDGNATITYTNNYTDIGYNFYNQLGQLIAAIAPEGVKKLAANMGGYTVIGDIPFLTLNEYDLQGRLIKVTETDAGTSEFIYRTDGNIRFSQNAEQKKIKPGEHKGKFSYTDYDRWGRPIESGEYVIPESSSVSFDAIKADVPLQDKTDADATISSLTKKSWVKTHYDQPDNSHNLSGYLQDEAFLKAGLSWTENTNAKTWYNYDENGRVVWMIKYIDGLGYKTVDYTYDGTGNVIKVDYQKNTTAERFTHQYEYDADSRLSVIYTSASGGTPKEQARYYYYLHGPLKRVELAENLQGIDYTYTPQGWLKAINHPDNVNDPGKDGTNGFAPDAFGMTLEYFNGDYSRQNTGINSLATATNKTYYNGIIGAQSWKSQKPQAVVNANPNVNDPAMFTYEYDDKYQFNNNKYGAPNFGANSFAEALNQNREHGISYDANGNIQALSRTNKDGNAINSLNYAYSPNTNKLASVSNYANYQYDDLGQMIGEQKTGGGEYYLSYDVSGKVTAIYADAAQTQLKVSFIYDEGGMRIRKTDHVQNISTYYVYDASGNVLALYDNNGTALQQKEVPVYAAGRIATYNRMNNFFQYELTDHLGNVRVVINETKTSTGQADVVYYSDYYPFGSPMTLAQNDYRYGYQGQYAEVDKETGWNNFMLRMYDPVIGRWMSTDPKNQYFSPYVGMGNNPVSGVDPDGGETQNQGVDKNGKIVFDDYRNDGNIFLVNDGFEGKINNLNDLTRNSIQIVKGGIFIGNDAQLQSLVKSQWKYAEGGFSGFEFTNKFTVNPNPQSNSLSVTSHSRDSKGNDYAVSASQIQLQISNLEGQNNEILSNIYNIRNSLAHEKNHLLKVTALYHIHFTSPIKTNHIQWELGAIEYQRNVPSWQKTTSGYKQGIKGYESTFKF